MNALDIVVNLWTPDLTEHYTPKLNAFWKKVKILGATHDGIELDEELRLMDAAGIDKGLLIATLVVSAVYSLCELALFWFVGLIIDWMQTTGPERFLEAHGLALVGMAVVVGIIRPATMLLARALVTFSITPSLGNRVRWRSHRYVLRQSLAFFQNDFAGRVAQKVMQTGPAASTGGSSR